MAYIELQKIQHTPDSSTTTIDSAGYYLEWVYRTVDKHKDYYILPVYKVENDSISFIRDETSKGLFKVFTNDSRVLYKKHNKGVTEMTGLPRMLARRPDEQ